VSILPYLLRIFAIKLLYSLLMVSHAVLKSMVLVLLVSVINSTCVWLVSGSGLCFSWYSNGRYSSLNLRLVLNAYRLLPFFGMSDAIVLRGDLYFCCVNISIMSWCTQSVCSAVMVSFVVSGSYSTLRMCL